MTNQCSPFLLRIWSRRKALLAGSAALVALVLVSALFGQDFDRLLARAEPYSAVCDSPDQACLAWKQFRQDHPFPYQTIQGRGLPGGSLAIIVSEPPPVLSRPALDSLVRSAFGPDLKSMARRRWKMGVDGWLEDLVLEVDTGARTGDPMANPLLRDRIAFLNLALFGTAFGSGIDIPVRTRAGAAEAPPNLKVTPYDVKQWLTDGNLTWNRLDAVSAQPTPWKTISASKTVGAFASSDRSLVLLSVPAALMRKAPSNPDGLNALRAAFRCFAVSADSLAGIFQDPAGHVAILGRWRTQSLASAPPLRFETFKLIASQSADELSQSYERGSLFAGKLEDGDYEYKDWAPIYLSDALVDTEFGALLNTTDQLLKSWSEAGNIEYLYFNYRRPKIFPFGEDPLSEVVSKLNGSSEVLFNWNTSGAGALVSGPAGKILTATQTGALPVTYGSETKESDNLETGHLLDQEEKAYNYFAARRDANLTRVVSYTMLYQFCRALASDGPPNPAPARTVSPDSAAMKARRAAAGVRVAATFNLLASLRKDDLDLEPKFKARVSAALQAAHDRYPAYTDQQLASLVADRFSPESKKLTGARQAQLRSLANSLSAAEDKYDARLAVVEGQIAQYNGSVSAMKAFPYVDDYTASDLARRKAAIEAEKASLTAQEAEIARQAAAFKTLRKLIETDPLNELRRVLAQVASETDLEPVRREFVKKNDYQPDGSIKTPSIVVSWNTRNALEALFTTGGHNVDSRTLRLEPSPDVAGISLDRTQKGYVLRYNPSRAASVEANANQLAREIEHHKVTSTPDLARIVEAAPPHVPQSRVAVLKLPEGARADPWVGKIGTRLYDQKSQMVDDLRAVAEKNSCCIFVAQDSEGVSIATERNLKPPPTVIAVEIRDSPSMSAYLGDVARRSGTGRERAVVFLDTPRSHVEAATLNVTGGSTSEADLARIANSLGARRAGEAEARVEAVNVRDLKGRSSTLSLTGRLEAGAREFFERISGPRTKAQWAQVEVSTLDQTSMAQFIQDIPWNVAEEGVPTGVLVKFGKATAAPIDVGVVAGFTGNPPAAARVTLKAMADRTAATASLKEASIAEYAATLRNDLQQMSTLKIRRLKIVVKHGEITTLLTLRWEAPDAYSTVHPG